MHLTQVAADLPRMDAKTLSSTLEALAARFGNRLVTSQAVRDQHAHTTSWLPRQPPDGVVFVQETADIQDVVRICAQRKVPVIAFGTKDDVPPGAESPMRKRTQAPVASGTAAKG